MQISTRKVVWAGLEELSNVVGGYFPLPDLGRLVSRPEFLFRHGFVDRIVHRTELRTELAALLAFLEPAATDGETDESATNGSLPAFRPLSFLSALADKVIPEGDMGAPSHNGEMPHGPAEDAEAAPATTGAEGRRRG